MTKSFEMDNNSVYGLIPLYAYSSDLPSCLLFHCLESAELLLLFGSTIVFLLVIASGFFLGGEPPSSQFEDSGGGGSLSPEVSKRSHLANQNSISFWPQDWFKGQAQA